MAEETCRQVQEDRTCLVFVREYFLFHDLKSNMESRDSSSKTFVPRVSSSTSLTGKGVQQMALSPTKGASTGGAKLAYNHTGSISRQTSTAASMLSKGTWPGGDDGNMVCMHKKSMFPESVVQRMAWVTRRRWRWLGKISHLKLRRDNLFRMHRQALQNMVHVPQLTWGDNEEDACDAWSWKKFRNKIRRRKSLKRGFHGCLPQTSGDSSQMQQIYQTCDAGVQSSSTSMGTGQDCRLLDSPKVKDGDLPRNVPLVRWVEHTSKPSSLRRKIGLTAPATVDAKGNRKLQDCAWEASTGETSEQECDSILSETSIPKGDHTLETWTPLEFCASTESVDDFPALTPTASRTHELKGELDFLNLFTYVPGSGVESVSERESSKATTLDTGEAVNSRDPSLLTFCEKGGSFVHCDLEDVQQLCLAQGPGEILIGGQFELSGGGMEFLFVDANSMSKVIGVGLTHSIVVLTTSLDVEVIKLGQMEWEAKWMAGLKTEASFNLMSVELLGLQERGSELITADEMAQRFGVGLTRSNGIATDLTMETDEADVEIEPFLFEVARFMLRNQPPRHPDDKHAEPAFAALFRRENNEASSCRSCRVTIHPKRSGVFIPDDSTGAVPPSLLNLAGIHPTLILQFEEGNGAKTFTIESIAECPVRGSATNVSEEDGCGWYQDHLYLSLRCVEDDKAVLLDSCGTLHTEEVANAPSQEVAADGGKDYRLCGSGISGQFHLQDASSMGEASLAYRFFRCEVPDFNLRQPGPDQKSFAQSSLCETLKPSIKGLWEPITDDEGMPYSFEMERLLLEKNAGSSEPADGQEVTEYFQLPLLVNHAMTHLQRVGEHRKSISRRASAYGKTSPT